ncbi:hypothetical protein Tco_0517754 [Tanacetum coccineum]
MFNTIRVISRHQDTQIYGAILPDELTNQDMKDSKAYKQYYAVASGAEPPKAKIKYKKKAYEPVTPSKKKTASALKGSRIKSSAKMAKSNKKKQPATKQKSKGLIVLSEVALSEAEQLKMATKRSKIQFHSSHASGSGDRVDTQSKVPDEQQQNVSGTNEGAGVEPEVPNVPKYTSESEEESWTFSQGDDDDDNDEHDLEDEKDDEDDDDKNDSEETESDDDGDDFGHPNLSTYNADDQEEEEEKEKEKEKADDDEVSSDQKVSTPPDHEVTEEDENQEGDDYINEGGEEGEEEDALYIDVNINLERSDAEMTNAQANQEMDDAHVTLTAEPPVSHNLVNVPVSVTAVTPSSASTILQPPVLIIQTLQQTPDSTTTTTIPTTTLPDIPNFASLKYAVDVAIQLQSNKLREVAQAKNEEFLKQIDSNMKVKIKEQINQSTSSSYAVAASLLEFELKKILIQKMEENKSINRSDVQKNLYNALVESYNFDSDIISSYGDVVTLKRGRDDQDKDEDPSARSNRGSKRMRLGKEAESSKELTHKESKSTSSSKGASRSQAKSSGKSAHAEEHGQKVDDLEEQSHQEFNTGNDDATPVKGFLATPIDFSAFIMNRLKIEYLTQDVLTDPTYDLMKGTYKSVVELEYHLEEVFKDTNDQLDWHNPEGRPYPHDLSKPLPLILNAQGRQVIPFDHFINNDLKYLKGGSLSQRYTTSITKTKAADYGQVKWIEDKVPRRIWRPKKVVYDKHAYWGTYHWGPKRQKLYGYAANMETSKDVYSRHMIIAVTSLKIMQFFCYSHLEEIIVRRKDDQLYKFREGDFKRLRRQDIEDMLLLLVQGKLTNLNLDERYALNVALRMYTRCIIIQECVEDLQLGVKSYQKKINLSRTDSYRSDLRKMTPYTAYPDIQGIIYQDDMDKNHLMRTEELHKFSDGTLNHVRTALNDIAIRIQMEYLPKRKWSKQDKQRARVMINAIDKNLKDRRLMRSLEKFVGGRPYGGDLRLLERTI